MNRNNFISVPRKKETFDSVESVGMIPQSEVVEQIPRECSIEDHDGRTSSEHGESEIMTRERKSPL